WAGPTRRRTACAATRRAAISSARSICPKRAPICASAASGGTGCSWRRARRSMPSMSKRRGRCGRNAALPALRRHRSDRHGDGGLGWIDHWDAERLLERAAVARHTGAAEHQRVGTVFFDQRPADRGHALERPLARGGFGDAHVEGPLAGQPVEEPYLAQV